MSVVCVSRRALLAVLCLLPLLAPNGVRAQSRLGLHPSFSSDLHTIKIVDAFNLFPNVGALIYFAEPNDAGIPPGIVAQCTGALIHERAVLVAGHCTAPAAGGLLPFVRAFVTFSPNALDRSTWRAVSSVANHPSLPPCPPPEYFCNFEGLAPGILDIGLAFLSQPVRDISPAKLAGQGTLETARAKGSLMIVPGYGFLGSLPGGPHGGVAPPISQWDGLRRIKLSRLEKVVDREWASWSLPGVICYGDSGTPTFFNPDPRAGRSHERIVAVVSDGGWVCFARDDRARVDTAAAQEWIRQTIAQVVRARR